MVTVGIDLAAQPEGTVCCRIVWRPDEVLVEPPIGDLDDAALTSACEGADKVGVDVPFGWPEEFADAVAAHRAGKPIGAAPMRQLRYRETDLYVHQETAKWPLSVSTDRIGITALRAARVFTPTDRSGQGQLVEVYPAAALRRWGFDSNGYKKKEGRETRAALVASFCGAIDSWCAVSGPVREAFVDRDDAFDAFISSLVARAAALGLCDPPTDARRAAIEGWIALPRREALSVIGRTTASSSS